MKVIILLLSYVIIKKIIIKLLRYKLKKQINEF